jgi:hypothetical protein
MVDLFDGLQATVEQTEVRSNRSLHDIYIATANVRGASKFHSPAFPRCYRVFAKSNMGVSISGWNTSLASWYVKVFNEGVGQQGRSG